MSIGADRRAALLALPLLLLVLPAPPDDAAGVARDGAGADAARVAHGRDLAERWQCGACHRIPGVRAAAGRAGPSLEGFAARSYIAGEVPNTPALLARWIVAPAALAPGTTMPALGVPPADARAIAAFLLADRE